MQIVDLFNDSILSLFAYLIDANKRIFGIYLLSAMLLAIPAYLVHARRYNRQSFAGYLFNKKIWLHPSARIDYTLFIINRLFKALFWGPFVLVMVPIAIGFSDLLELTFGNLTAITNNSIIVISVFTLLLFILDDLSRFLLHLALHKVPVLWDFHKVHHSAKVLTPMTIYRSHPFESFLYACRMALSQGIAVGLSYYLFGPTLSMFEWLGANVLVFIFNLMGSNLRHSHVWLSWGDTLEHWFISPAQHQIHHSDNPLHFDQNLGSALAIWDRAFNTLILASQVGKIKFGINKHDPGHQSLLQAYYLPFKDVYKRLRAAK